MQIRNKLLSAVAVLGLCAAQYASAVVVGVDLGTGLPPGTLGGYTMSSFEPGAITGESYTAHEVSGFGSDGWATWGQSYTGAVHVVLGATPLTLTLSGAHAVYFYEEPNQFSDFYMTATDSSGVSVTTLINGYHGSSGIGFYETDLSAFLTSITVTCTDPTGFAIGEFGVDGQGSVHGQTGAVPDSGSTLMLLSGVVFALVGLRRRLT